MTWVIVRYDRGSGYKFADVVRDNEHNWTGELTSSTKPFQTEKGAVDHINRHKLPGAFAHEVLLTSRFKLAHIEDVRQWPVRINDDKNMHTICEFESLVALYVYRNPPNILINKRRHQEALEHANRTGKPLVVRLQQEEDTTGYWEKPSDWVYSYPVLQGRYGPYYKVPFKSAVLTA